MEESAQNTFEYFCAAAFNFGVRRTARIVHEVQIASKFRIPGIFLTYIGNRMRNQSTGTKEALYVCPSNYLRVNIRVLD